MSESVIRSLYGMCDSWKETHRRLESNADAFSEPVQRVHLKEMARQAESVVDELEAILEIAESCESEVTK